METVFALANGDFEWATPIDYKWIRGSMFSAQDWIGLPSDGPFFDTGMNLNTSAIPSPGELLWYRVQMNCGGSPGLGEAVLGTPLAVNFSPLLLVDQLLVEVADSWLTDPAISLHTNIMGINGIFEFHGTDIIDVVDTVCVQPRRNTTDLIGPVKCVAFGPF